MRRTKPAAARMVAAFGIGVLLSIILPSQWMLVLAVVTLIAVAIGASTAIRG